jgi:hypothetical protein
MWCETTERSGEDMSKGRFERWNRWTFKVPTIGLWGYSTTSLCNHSFFLSAWGPDYIERHNFHNSFDGQIYIATFTRWTKTDWWRLVKFRWSQRFHFIHDRWCQLSMARLSYPEFTIRQNKQREKHVFRSHIILSPRRRVSSRGRYLQCERVWSRDSGEGLEDWKIEARLQFRDENIHHIFLHK